MKPEEKLELVYRFLTHRLHHIRAFLRLVEDGHIKCADEGTIANAKAQLYELEFLCNTISDDKTLKNVVVTLDKKGGYKY